MINIKIKDCSSLKNIMQGLSALLPELRIDVRDDGLYSASMCQANAAAVFFSMNKLMFAEYSHSPDDFMIMNAKDFCNVIKVAKENDEVVLSTDENNAKLFVTITQGLKTKEYELPLLHESNINVPPKDSLDLPCSVNLFRDVFQDALNSSLVLGNEKKVYLLNEKNKLLIGKNEIGKRTKIELSSSKFSDRFMAQYNSDYITKFLGCMGNMSDFKLSFGNNMPMMMEVNSKDRYRVWIMVAPIVENE